MSNLGPYELRGELGRGAMAVVWRAYDPSLDREVAIKEPLFPDGLNEATKEELATRFVREARSVAKLSHPGIITVHSADVFDGRPAIVMELIEGSTLGELLSSQRLSPEQTVSILDQLLEAVAFAHGKGIVHRDIKPDNIFVSPDGRIKLADFGIAHNAEAATNLTQAGTIMGTYGYMAPEQIRGEAVDARADLFSVGAIAYECMTGRNPFGLTESETVATIIYKVTHEDPAPLDPEFYPEWLIGITSGLLQRDASTRYQTATDALNDLRAQVTSVLVKPPIAKSNTLKYAIVGLVIAVVALGAGSLLSSQPRTTGEFDSVATIGKTDDAGSGGTGVTSEEKSQDVVQEIAFARNGAIWVMGAAGQDPRKVSLSGDESLENYQGEGGIIHELIWSESQRTLFFLTNRELGPEESALWSLDDSGVVTKVWSAADPSAATSLAEMPDGRIVIMSESGAVSTIDPESHQPGGSVIQLDDGHGSKAGFADVEWDPNGKDVLFLGSNFPHIASLEGKARTGSDYSDELLYDWFHDISWGPDGNRFVVANSDSDSIELFDNFRNRMRRIVDHDDWISSVDWGPSSSIVFQLGESVWTVDINGETETELAAGSSPSWIPSTAFPGNSEAKEQALDSSHSKLDTTDLDPFETLPLSDDQMTPAPPLTEEMISQSSGQLPPGHVPAVSAP